MLGRKHTQMIIIAGLMTMVTMVHSAQINSVCTAVPDDTTHPGLRPRLANQFKVDVECKLENMGKTVYVREYYDLPLNRGRMRVIEPTGETEYYMDYDQRVILKVNPDTSQCETGLLLLSPDRLIFGYRLSGGNAQMYSPSGALHFGNASEQYRGEGVVRGIDVDHWYSCQYIQQFDATANVNWYFSKKDNWTMETGGTVRVAPIRMTVDGQMVLSNGTIIPFNNTYDFFNYQPSVDPHDLEVPDGVFCPGRNDAISQKPFPTVPSTFFFIAEVNDPYKQKYTTFEIGYDNRTRLTAFVFKGDETSFTEITEYVEFDDYNTGVSYLMNTDLGSCSISSMADANNPFASSATNMTMEAAKTIFLDSYVNYQYAGTEVVRDIPCDRWVALYDRLPGYQGQNLTVEWYFAAADHYSWNDASTTPKYRMPVLFRYYLPGSVRSQGPDTSIFFYSTRDYGYGMLDASMCFNDTERKTILFTFSKTNEGDIRSDVYQTKVAIQSAISTTCGISSLRVTNVQLYFDPSKVTVTLDLLGRPPHYDTMPYAAHQNTLSAAYQLLNDSFSHNVFIISFAKGANVVTIKPSPNSLEDITGTPTAGTITPSPRSPGHHTGSPAAGTITPSPRSPGHHTGSPAAGTSTPSYNYTGTHGGSGDSYSGGALAGLGVAMLLVGGAGGGVGAFFFFK